MDWSLKFYIKIPVFLVLLVRIQCFGLPENPAKCQQFSPPSQQQLQAASNLFNDWFSNQAISKADLLQTGLKLIQQKDSPAENLVEPSANCQDHCLGHCLGQGNFYYSANAKYKVMIQAPHQYTDLNTGRILRSLISNGNILAAFTNSSKRSRQSDVTHQDNSYLLKFTQSFVKHYPNKFVIQLHGFSNSKRKYKNARNADIILSQGTRSPGKKILQLQSCLKNYLKLQVSVFPLDTQDLGAEKNIIGRWVNANSKNKFIHIEMNYQTRQLLITDSEKRKQLKICLVHLIINH